MQDLSQRMQASANRVLTAVDWPPAEPEASKSSGSGSGPAAASARHGGSGRVRRAGTPAEQSAGSEQLERFASAGSAPLSAEPGQPTDTDGWGLEDQSGSHGETGVTQAGHTDSGADLKRLSQRRPSSGLAHDADAADVARTSSGVGSGSSGSSEGETLTRWARQLAVFRFAAQDWAERLWQVRKISGVYIGGLYEPSMYDKTKHQ